MYLYTASCSTQRVPIVFYGWSRFDTLLLALLFTCVPPRLEMKRMWCTFTTVTPFPRRPCLFLWTSYSSALVLFILLERASFSPSNLLIRITDFTNILPHDDLPLLLRTNMLNPNFLAVLCHETAYENWIPEFTGDAQIFTATHQGI
jgi:hypothetical protein